MYMSYFPVYYSFPPSNVIYHPYGTYLYRPQYPEVNPSMFNESAIEMQKLLRDASVILDRLAQSKSFAKKVMSAAQESQQKEVERLIETTGVQSIVETTFNPDGIRLKLSSKNGKQECCELNILLRWR